MINSPYKHNYTLKAMKTVATVTCQASVVNNPIIRVNRDGHDTTVCK